MQGPVILTQHKYWTNRNRWAGKPVERLPAGRKMLADSFVVFPTSPSSWGRGFLSWGLRGSKAETEGRATYGPVPGLYCSPQALLQALASRQLIKYRLAWAIQRKVFNLSCCLWHVFCGYQIRAEKKRVFVFPKMELLEWKGREGNN